VANAAFRRAGSDVTLKQHGPRALPALNPLDAERWGLGEGDPVRVANERGEMITTVTLRDRLPEGLATYPEHFDEQARVLMPLTIDNGAGVPYYRSARVEIEPLKDVELERMR